MSNRNSQESYNYGCFPCNQDPQNNAQYCYSKYNTQTSTTYDFMYVSQTLPSQNIYARNLSTVYSTQLESNNCLQDIEKAVKLCDKIENIEISSKDLSPVGCNNVELMLPDISKNIGKDNYYKQDQWFCNANYNQKYEYPSCSQMTFNDSFCHEKTVKYCSIQKPVECQEQRHNETMYGINTSYDKVDCGENYNTLTDYNYYNQQIFPLETQFNLDQDSDSDIIVEESEEDDYNYDMETTCIICNVLYTVAGNQFYILAPESPLTMSSQKPVLSKLIDLLGALPDKKLHLCSECLALINTIDHLHYKLENCKSELMNKFSKTIKTSNIVLNKKPQNNNCKHKFTCKLCKKIFSIRTIYQTHLKHHAMKKNFLCELCGKSFSKQSQFNIHHRIHKVNHVSLKKIAAFCCTSCKKPFRTKTNLKEHENYCTGKLPYKCKFCEKKFPTSTKLKNHIKLKHDKKFTSICSICNIGFVKLSDYKSHMISHSTAKKFNCSECDKSYKTLSNLNFHMKFHNMKLPFVCTICDKGFMRKEYLESHVNMHNGTKNFNCTSCDKKFVSQKNLDAHTKYHDGGSIKKSCNICGKMISGRLEDHIRTHNNLKEFQCGNCEMRFNTKGALVKHKKRKHEGN